MGVRVGFQFFPARHGFGARSRPCLHRPEDSMIWTRRRLLGLGGAMAGMAAVGGWARPAGAREPLRKGTGVAAKRIALKNLHTGEELETEFFRDGAYVA